MCNCHGKYTQNPNNDLHGSCSRLHCQKTDVVFQTSDCHISDDKDGIPQTLYFVTCVANENVQKDNWISSLIRSDTQQPMSYIRELFPLSSISNS